MAAALETLPKDGDIDDHPASWLVLYDQEGSVKFSEGLLAVAEACGVWEKVIVASKWLPLRGPDEWPVPFSRYRQGLGRLLGSVEVCELWLQHLHSFAERLLLELYPDASITLCEDGLGAYAAPVMWRQTARDVLRIVTRHPTLLWPGRLNRQLASERICNWRWNTGHVRRIHRRYLLLADVFGHAAPFSQETDVLIPRSLMMDTLRRVRKELLQVAKINIAVNFHPEDTILLVADRTMLFTDRAQGIEFYRTIVSQLTNKGYSVLWRDHPREKETLFDEAVAGMPRDRIHYWPFPAAWPVEIMAMEMPFAGCVCGCSSSPWYLERYAGILAYGYGKKLIEAYGINLLPGFVDSEFSFRKMRDLASIPQRVPGESKTSESCDGQLAGENHMRRRACQD